MLRPILQYELLARAYIRSHGFSEIFFLSLLVTMVNGHGHNIDGTCAGTTFQIRTTVSAIRPGPRSVGLPRAVVALGGLWSSGRISDDR